MIDTHAHLDALEDVDGALMRAREAGVSRVITIGPGGTFVAAGTSTQQSVTATRTEFPTNLGMMAGQVIGLTTPSDESDKLEHLSSVDATTDTFFNQLTDGTTDTFGMGGGQGTFADEIGARFFYQPVISAISAWWSGSSKAAESTSGTTRAYPGDAGLDLVSCERHELGPGARAIVGTGIVGDSVGWSLSSVWLKTANSW